jgi:hypothetical protein
VLKKVLEKRRSISTQSCAASLIEADKYDLKLLLCAASAFSASLR